MPKLIMGLPEKFWAKTRIEDLGHETPCITWTGSKTAAGYGNLRHQGGYAYAHRLAFQTRFGEIPKRTEGDRAVIDHLCRNRACVNPTHMELVTNRINILRGETIQAAHAAQTHCVNGHEFTEDNTYMRTKGSRSCRACSLEWQRKNYVSKERARKTHCAKGHEFTEENTYTKKNGRRQCRTCAKELRKKRTEREQELRDTPPSA